jgi:hypothetical protein
MVMPTCLPPAAGVGTTLCAPDRTFTLLPQFGHLSVYTHGAVSTPTEIAHAKIGVAPRGVARVVHRFAPAHGLEATHDDLNDRGSLARDF